MTTTAAATGIRCWVAARRPEWLTAVRLRGLTAALLAAAVVGAGLAS